MKKIVLLFALVFSLSLSVSAEEYHWFYKPTDDARPTMPPIGVADPGEHALLIGKDEKRVYLTFDAGYVNENVLKITEVLEKENVPAAFFILKQVVQEEPELLARWKKAGFLVCNHTLTHVNCTRVSKEKLTEELQGLERLYSEKTGKALDRFFRPPEGAYNQSVIDTAAELGYKTVFWSAAYADWDNDSQMPPDKALDLMLRRTHNGALVLLHPTSATNAAILQDYIRALKTAGYTFGSLEEI